MASAAGSTASASNSSLNDNNNVNHGSSHQDSSPLLNHSSDCIDQDLDLDQSQPPSTSNNSNNGQMDSSRQAQSTDQDEDELEEIKARVREMEEEAEKLKQMQDDITSQISNTGSNDLSTLSPEERAEIDSRSIYVGNVDYSATAQDLEKHFHGCGSINRVTILFDRYTGHPKGFAYIEFADKDSVETATALDESLFKGRQIKVNPKRTNRPGISTTNRPPRGRLMGRGGVGRAFGPVGFGRGSFSGSPWFRGGGRGRGFRRGGWYGYSPY